MPLPVIFVDNLTRRFGSFLAVDHVSFEVAAGEVVGYLGPNGCGKTTTIRMLLGIIRPDAGSATVLGFDSARQSEEVRARTGYMSQKFALYHELTSLENLTFYAGMYGVTDKRRLQEVLELLGLDEIAAQQVRTLSAGWKQRLALAAAIVHRPQLLLLDEPTSGVDPTARRVFWDLMYELASSGITILVTTHYMDEAEYCNRVGILNNGKLLALDSPTNLKLALPGRMWEITSQSADAEQTAPLLPILDQMKTMPGILRASLAGDHVHALTASELDANHLASYLAHGDFHPVIEPAPVEMEDVFLSLIGSVNQ
jgi:ABC-2 type transport system ATP-binding protein